MSRYMKRLFHFIFIFVALLLMASCSTTKYVADGDFLLNDINVTCDDPQVNATDLYDCVGEIVSFVRNQGYYNFTKENLYYSVDSTLGSHEVDLKLNLHIDTSRVGHPLTRYRTSWWATTVARRRDMTLLCIGV